jgi:hypothetical protein
MDKLKIGDYSLTFSEEEILDDYRFANFKLLRFPDIVTNEADQTKLSLIVE